MITDAVITEWTPATRSERSLAASVILQALSDALCPIAPGYANTARCRHDRKVTLAEQQDAIAWFMFEGSKPGDFEWWCSCMGDFNAEVVRKYIQSVQEGQRVFSFRAVRYLYRRQHERPRT